MAGDRQKCLDAGMDGYISKPFDPPELRRILGELGKKRAAEAAGVEPIARAELWDRLCESAELLREVVAMFVSELPSTRQALTSAVEAGGAEALVAAAHRVRGALLGLAAVPAALLAEQLETIGRAGSTEGAAELLRAFEARARPGRARARRLERVDARSSSRATVQDLRGGTRRATA